MHRIARVRFLALVFLAACAQPGPRPGPGPGPSQPPPAAAPAQTPEAITAAPPGKPPAPQAAPKAASIPGAQPAQASPAPPVQAAQAPGAAVTPPSAPPPAPPSGAARAKARPSTASHPVKPAEEKQPAPREKPAAVASAPPQPAAAPAVAAAPALDLTSLEDRLRNTRAIGVFTKLSLKNNVDDLLTAFRAFYNGVLRTTLADLRQRYDALLMKVLTLLQNGDPPLAQAVSASRDAIWGILSDRDKFQKFSH